MCPGISFFDFSSGTEAACPRNVNTLLYDAGAFFEILLKILSTNVLEAYFRSDQKNESKNAHFLLLFHQL